jgi:LysR family transcriptional regulator, cys regulon transcriptional activator
MKLHQLRFVNEVVKQGMSISAAAGVLHTSQPGVSKQIQLLEEELNLHIFERHGKRLTGLTEPGKAIVDLAKRMLRDMENIKRVGDEFSHTDIGELTVATTHTQARYRLPGAVKAFIEKYPNVKLNIHQGNPVQVAEQVKNGEADIGIATESISQFEGIFCIPAYQWNRCVVVPEGHPMIQDVPLTLEKLAKYPLITYDFAFTGGSLVSRVFNEAHLSPNVVLTAIDADVIKTYVGLGLGVGLVASMAYDKERDTGLVAMDAKHLFPDSTTFVGIRRNAYLRRFAYDFIGLLAPGFDERSIRQAMEG